MYCVYCGVKNADVANFCSNCGKEAISKQTEEVIESSDEPQSKVRVHHPWMTAQPSEEQSRQQVQPQPPERQEPQEQDDGEVSKLVKRIQGWSVKEKILWGMIASFLFLVCVVAIAGEPVEEDSSPVAESGAPISNSLEPPKALVEVFADTSKGEIHEGYWYEAGERCQKYTEELPEFSEESFQEMIDEATILIKELDLTMPTNHQLDELQSVYDGTVASSDTWANAWFTDYTVRRIFLKSIDLITERKFGTKSLFDPRVQEWRNTDDGSAEWALVQSYKDNSNALEHWFSCGTAKAQTVAHVRAPKPKITPKPTSTSKVREEDTLVPVTATATFPPTVIPPAIPTIAPQVATTGSALTPIPVPTGKSRSNPAPKGPGGVLDTSDGFQITVANTIYGMTELVVVTNLGIQPPAGHEYVLVGIVVTNLASDVGRFRKHRLQTVGTSDIEYNQGCGALPSVGASGGWVSGGEFDSRHTIYKGDALAGYVCFRVKSSDIGSLVMYDNAPDGEKLFWALDE